MVIVETERLVLRHVTLCDTRAMMGVFGDPAVMHFGDGIQSETWVQDWLRACIEQHYPQLGYGPYAVVERVSRTVIGYCGLFNFPDLGGRSEIEVGYRLARSAWGHGFATEAALAVRDYAFTTLSLTRLVALIDSRNSPSIRVATKLGMRFEREVMLPGYTHPDNLYVVSLRREREVRG